MQHTTAKSKRERFQASVAAGRSVREASITVGVAESTGYAWARAHGQDAQSATATEGKTGFARLIRQSDAQTFIELEVSGVVIRVPRGFDADSLAQLIGVLRRSA